MVMHHEFFPFKEAEFEGHFGTSADHTKYYSNSLNKYQLLMNNLSNIQTQKGMSISKLKKDCQLEKDERFWTASAFMSIFHKGQTLKELILLLTKVYGNTPPIKNCDSWEEFFGSDPSLYFEADIPSPTNYKNWLGSNLTKRQFIPYIIDSSYHKTSDTVKSNLEGSTQADALIITGEGYAIIIEAKLLSDISCQITYDTMRNQLIRNIDVMLERYTNLSPPKKLIDEKEKKYRNLLQDRDPDKTLFLLLTPQIFKNNPYSRLYGHLFNEYKNNPESLKRDMPHRSDIDASFVSSRLGWLTWEDIRKENSHFDKWLNNIRI